MTDLTEYLAKAREEANEAENAMSRALYAIDKAIEALGASTPAPAPTPPPPPVTDPFNAGASFPALATVIIDDCEVPVGATVAHVKVRLDKETANTIYAFVRCYNGTGGRANPDTTKTVIFRPEGPLEQTVSFDIAYMAEGNTCLLTQANEPDGAKRGPSGKVIAVAGAVNEPLPPIPAPEPFAPLGALAYEATGRECLESGAWLDRLAHGRTQDGNSETGYYHPDAFGIDGDDLLLKSYRLAEPAQVGLKHYPFAASIMTGLVDEGAGWPKVNPDLVFKYGTIEWDVKMPNRKGSWPALWLCSVSGNDYPQWPFEIDLFEGFYFHWHKPGSDLSANLHFGKEGGNNRSIAPRGGMRYKMRDLGLEPTLDTEFHKFACTVTSEWIVTHIDGVEAYRWRNPFDTTKGFYPLMQCAVKADITDPYDTGSGDMTVRSVRIWRA